ncbi:MAG TPA: hypothetical protein VFE50_24435 [Cyclobacteriaceae bacterium]|nr:hypothetical protein [Cyclobacteriaceae bacterium]
MKPIVLLTLASLAFACSPGTTSETSSDPSSASLNPSDTLHPFINWLEVGVRDTPGEKGKYLTTVYLAEEIEVLGDTASEISGKNRVHYSKIKLVDGKECWIRSDFITTDYDPAVAFRNSGIFSRPDRAAVTGKRFEDYDVIAVRFAKHGWLEARGIASGEKWFTHGYISTEDVLGTSDDVQFAAIMKRAAVAKDPKMKEALEAQFENFSGTMLYAAIYGPDETTEEFGGAEEYSDEGEEQAYEASTDYILGEWMKSWEDPNGNAMSETVSISGDLRYTVIGQSISYSITELKFDKENGGITFVKAGEDSKTDIELSIMSYSIMKGTESQGEGGSIDVTYTRIGN